MWKFRLRNLTEETAQRASNGLKPRLSGSKVYPLGLYAAAAAAKLLQSCPTLCDPIDGSPPGSPVPGVLQARTLEWVAISFSNAWKWKVKVKSLSRVELLATPWTAAHQAPLSNGIFLNSIWKEWCTQLSWVQVLTVPLTSQITAWFA